MYLTALSLGQVIKYRLEEYNGSQRNPEKTYRDYEAHHPKIFLEISSFNVKAVEKLEEV